MCHFILQLQLLEKIPIKDRLGVSFAFKLLKFPLYFRDLQRNQEIICMMKICQNFAGFAWTFI